MALYAAIARRITRVVVVAMLTAVAAAVPSGSVAAHPSTQHGLQTGVSELHDLGITGVQATTRDGHRSSWARAGVRDLKTDAPVPYNGYFRMGSNTKTFAAVVVLQLVEEGELSLDDTVEEWLPGLVQGNGYDGSAITVRQLLQHTSGIFNYTNDMEVLTSEQAYYAHRFDHFEPVELVELALEHEPVFDPGERWEYSNTNYILAGMIVEEITGHTWAAEVKRRILNPLGMRHTASPGDWPYLPRPHARGYQQFVEDGPLVDTTTWNPSAAYAAGDMVTTPADMTTFWRALQQGRLLEPAQLAEMQDTVPAEGLEEYLPGAEYGLGVFWLPGSCGGYWGHGGDVLGMSTVNGVTPDGDRATVIALSTQLADPESVVAVNDRALELVDDTLCRN